MPLHKMSSSYCLQTANLKFLVLSLNVVNIKQTNKTNSVAISPRANYTDWATATYRRNLVSTFVDRGVVVNISGSKLIRNLSWKCKFLRQYFCSGVEDLAAQELKECCVMKIKRAEIRTFICSRYQTRTSSPRIYVEQYIRTLLQTCDKERLQNRVLRTIGNFPRRISVRDLQCFQIPYVYD
jgi:hypothetical protein